MATTTLLLLVAAIFSLCNCQVRYHSTTRESPSPLHLMHSLGVHTMNPIKQLARCLRAHIIIQSKVIMSQCVAWMMASSDTHFYTIEGIIQSKVIMCALDDGALK